MTKQEIQDLVDAVRGKLETIQGTIQDLETDMDRLLGNDKYWNRENKSPLAKLESAIGEMEE
jgi:hypothetical protein